jgi:toxin-antitoxin system PIN domain toxin
MIYLADANLLIASALPNHVNHAAARKWFDEGLGFATTPITELALIRVITHRSHGVAFPDALAALQAIKELSHHRFWPADLEVSSRVFNGEIPSGHTTDAYLLALAGQNDGKLATFDHGIRKIARGLERHLEVLIP